MNSNKMNESNETKETEVSSSQSNMQEGGYDYEVVDTGLFDEFYCSICQKLKRNAVELKCQHSLCSNCLDQWEIKAEEMKVEFNCPECRQSIDKRTIQYSGTVNRMIQTSIRIKCTNFSVGCDWIGVIADIQEHIDRICNYTVIKCTFTECGVYVQRKELSGHLKGCDYRPVPCLHCSDQIIWINLKKHHLTECRLFPMMCSNEGCQEVIAREKLHLHEENDCGFMKITCQYASVGCFMKFLRREQEDHEKHLMPTHVFLLLQNNLSVHKDLEDTKSEFQATKSELLATKAELLKIKQRLDESDDRLKATKNEIVETRNCVEAGKLDLKNTQKNLDEITKQLTSTPVPLAGGWQRLNSSIGFEVKLLVELFRDDIDTKLRKCEESNKMVKCLLEELQNQITLVLSNWSDTIPNIKSCLDLQSEALEIFSKYKMVDFKVVSEYHVFRSKLPDCYVDYLLKYTQVERLEEHRAKLYENHQNIVDFLGTIVSRLNEKLEPCILNNIKDCDMLTVDPYMIIKCSDYHAMDTKILSPLYHFKKDVLWQQVNNGRCELFSRDVEKPFSVQNVNTGSDTDGYMVLKLFPDLLRKHLNTKLKEYEEFKTLAEALQRAVTQYLNNGTTEQRTTLRSGFADIQLKAFDCFSKRPVDLMRSSIQHHMSRFILPDGYEKYLWKYVRMEHLDEDYSKIMLKQQSIIDTLTKKICRFNQDICDLIHGQRGLIGNKHIVMQMESIDCLDALYYFDRYTATRQMDGKWVTFKSNGYTHETQFPIEMNANEKIYMVCNKKAIK